MDFTTEFLDTNRCQIQIQIWSYSQELTHSTESHIKKEEIIPQQAYRSWQTIH